MSIKLLGHTTIHFYRVHNLEHQRAFYQDVLGLTLYKDQGQCLIFNVSDNAKIGFCTHHPRVIKDDTCMTFVFDTLAELEAVHAHLKNHGIACEPMQTHEAFNIIHFFTRDPAQHLLEFQIFIES